MDAVRRPVVRLTSLTSATFLLALALACSSGPPPETTGIPGFEPTVKVVPIGANDHFSVLDSSDIVVASRDRSLLGGIFLLLDDAQLPYRRYFQTLPPRTAVGLIVQPADSAAMDSVVRTSGAKIIVWEHVNIPRDREGNPLPIARLLVSSTAKDTAAGSAETRIDERSTPCVRAAAALTARARASALPLPSMPAYTTTSWRAAARVTTAWS